MYVNVDCILISVFENVEKYDSWMWLWTHKVNIFAYKYFLSFMSKTTVIVDLIWIEVPAYDWHITYSNLIQSFTCFQSSWQHELVTETNIKFRITSMAVCKPEQKTSPKGAQHATQVFPFLISFNFCACRMWFYGLKKKVLRNIQNSKFHLLYLFSKKI